jgi:glycosidase
MNYWQRKRIFSFLLLLILSFSFIYPQSVVKHPEWSYNKSIYEVNVRQYSPQGTFKEFEKHLPRLKNMGAGILWLMPINPIGEKNRKGTLGSYYAVKDYKAVNPEYGTIDDFKSLVNAAHKLGMYVIIDWVANHTSWDNKLASEHPDWFTKDSLGNFVPPVADWADVIDLNYDNKQLREYMIGALEFWIKECNIDGYRCDVAGMVPPDFWVEARTRLNKIKPVFMLAEAEEPDIHRAFDMTYSWNQHNVMNGIASGKKNVTDLVNLLNEEKAKYPSTAFRMRFTSNHDENSWNGTEFERLGDAVETFAVLTAVIPGMPLVYSGQEAGYNKRLEFFERDPIVWNDTSRYGKVYKAIFNYKLKSKALQSGEKGSKLQLLSSPDDKNIFAFIRESGSEKVICVFNLSKESRNTSLNSRLIKGKYKNLFTGEKVTLNQVTSFELKPWEYKVFVTK